MFITRQKIDDQRGNESTQTVLIMAVGALILLAVHRLYREVSPVLRQTIQSVVTDRQILFGTNSPIQAAATPSTIVAPTIKNESVSGTDQFVGDANGSRESDLRRAEAMVTEAIRYDRRAEIEHLAGNTATEDQLRANSAELKLAAARIRGGDREVSNTKKQIEAANAMRDLWDVADHGSNALPSSIEKFYKWAKIPIRDGLPQITEVTVGLEQKFHRWLAEQLSKSNEDSSNR